MNEKSNNFLITLVFFSLFLPNLYACSKNKNNKAGGIISKDIVITEKMENEQYESDIQFVQEQQNQENTKKTTVNVDTNKIYEQSEIKEAICPQSNSEAMKFCTEHFKYPSPAPKVNGEILTDLIIEKNGKISDVILIKGLHPELDKETIRVFKLLPQFIPGKLNGQPVRSKYRMSMAVLFM